MKLQSISFTKNKREREWEVARIKFQVRKHLLKQSYSGKESFRVKSRRVDERIGGVETFGRRPQCEARGVGSSHGQSWRKQSHGILGSSLFGQLKAWLWVALKRAWAQDRGQSIRRCRSPEVKGVPRERYHQRCSQLKHPWLNPISISQGCSQNWIVQRRRASNKASKEITSPKVPLWKWKQRWQIHPCDDSQLQRVR